MSWLTQLPPKERRGSRPRCVLLMDGTRDEVAHQLTRLVNLPDVLVTPKDEWMPRGKSAPKELDLVKSNKLVSDSDRRKLTEWWLEVVSSWSKTPNWDIASTCTIEGKSGLLLIEAKAHANELGGRDKSGSREPNRGQIGRAIAEAAHALEVATGKAWNISRDHHYQLSNRFAWAWKLTTLGIPVVLVYLGFLNACEMKDKGEPFFSESDWERVLKEHCECVIDNTCWGQRLDFDGLPLFPIIRAVDQPFDPEVE